MSTDLSNAQALAASTAGDFRYHTSRKIWIRWERGHWRDDAGSHGIMQAAAALTESLVSDARNVQGEAERRRAIARALSSQSAPRLSAMVTLARSMPGVAISAVDFDSKPMLLGCPNGTLDLTTGQLRRALRGDFITRSCSAPWDPYAEANGPRWAQVVRTVTQGNLQLAAYLQASLGLALLGEWREKAIWFAYGPPDGGKSTFLNAIAYALGTYHTAADASTWLRQTSTGGNRGDLTRLCGARLVTTLETPHEEKWNSELLKRITGGDPITAAAKYESEITYSPQFCLWFGANDRPMARADDAGFWARMRCVPFTGSVSAAQRDVRIADRLREPAEASAILAWLVAGCRAYLSRGLPECLDVSDASTSYRLASNRLAEFADDTLTITRDPFDTVSLPAMRRFFHAWCRTRGVRPCSSAEFARSARQLGITGGDDSSRIRRVRQWQGVTVNAEYASEFMLVSE